jgi:predicted NUDIX family NTP pyrophosphohydrolase
MEGNLDPRTIVSNTFELEWPPRSGKKQQVPEIDKGEWFGVPTAKEKINESQATLIDELITKLNLEPEQTRDNILKGDKPPVQPDLF